ncbi:pilus assembly protein CpaE [Trinickia dabaoshanensis]|uniref:Pilus assembly protein CpaE n=1 Tax=Trinickia dabaoshanensis TaxID=564714 RepID=A0A2N7VY86_9BURK|nr:AAA family ATPase [Trinickia dabaoshanensis]PMS22122.1 pilus assembly protein CpaE [Trinickia dabaoshanensis]
MLDILLISSDEERAGRIAALVAQENAGHCLRTIRAGASRLGEYRESAQKADLLIIDDVHLAQRDLAAVEAIAASAPRLSCLLVTPSLSQDWLVAAMRAGVRHVLSWPIDEASFAAEISLIGEKKSAGAGRESRMLSFVSPRGGSGTTFIAVNLAYTLARERGKRTLLIDLSRQFGDAHLMLADKPPAATLVDVCSQVDRLDSAFFETCAMHVHPNLDVLAGASDPIKAADVRPAHVERIFSLVMPRYDAVLVDLGRSVDPVSMLALDRSSDVGIVLRQSIPHLHTGRRLVDILRELGYPGAKLRLLLNEYDKSATVDVATLEQALGLRVTHRLPRDEKQAGRAVEQGTPLLEVAKASPLTRSIDALADLLWPEHTEAAPSMFSRLFTSKPAASPMRALKTES